MPSKNESDSAISGPVSGPFTGHGPLAELRVEVAQFRPRKGAVADNLAAIADWVADTVGEADLVIFPETATSGYFVEGGVEEVARNAGEIIDGLGSPPEGAPDLVLGAYERGPDGVNYNAALHLEPSGEGDARTWRVVHLHRKVFLPTYGMFDEARFVKPGLEIEAYDTRFGRMGILICEEMLHSLPPTILALDGAEFLVALSASPAREYRPGPGHPASLERWHVAARALTLEHGVHLALAHPVGSEGGRIFAGGSAVYGPGGRMLDVAPLFREVGLRVRVPLAMGRIARVRSPMLEDLRAFLPHVGRALERAGRRRPSASSAPSTGDPAGSRAPETGAARQGPGGSHPHPRIDPEDTRPLELDLDLVETALTSFLVDEVVTRRGFRTWSSGCREAWTRRSRWPRGPGLRRRTAFTPSSSPTPPPPPRV
jgi:predicted amidohydrolase